MYEWRHRRRGRMCYRHGVVSIELSDVLARRGRIGRCGRQCLGALTIGDATDHLLVTLPSTSQRDASSDLSTYCCSLFDLFAFLIWNICREFWRLYNVCDKNCFSQLSVSIFIGSITCIFSKDCEWKLNTSNYYKYTQLIGCLAVDPTL